MTEYGSTLFLGQAETVQIANIFNPFQLAQTKQADMGFHFLQMHYAIFSESMDHIFHYSFNLFIYVKF